MTEAAIYEYLNELFSELFLREDIRVTSETMAGDIDGWDSYKQIDIVMAVEEKFGIEMETSEIDALKNVGDLVALIVDKTT